MNSSTFTYSDLTTVTLYHQEPVEMKASHSILVLPGMGIRSTFYFKFAKQMVANGLEVFLVDYRGVGTSSIQIGKKMDFTFDQWIDDGIELISAIQTTKKADKLLLLGHSMGGQLACLIASRSPLVSGVVMIASCHIYYKRFPFPERYSFQLAARTFPIIAKIFGYFPGDRIGFGGRVPKGIIKDWATNILTGKYTSRSGYDYQKLLIDLSKPIFNLSFEADRYSSDQAVDSFFDLLGHSALLTKLRIKVDEEDIAHDHYSWARKPDGIVGYIAEWIRKST